LGIRRYRSKSLIISVLMMMVCVQSFSMHFHFADDGHQPHAHSHPLSNVHSDHETIEHQDKINTDMLGTLAKHLLSLDLFVSLLLIFVFTYQYISRYWLSFFEKLPPYQLFFIRPPLRAPPL